MNARNKSDLLYKRANTVIPGGIYGHVAPGAGLTTEAIVTGCPIIFDLSGGCMPQEKINLNFWRSRQGKVISSSSPREIVKIIQSKEPIPSLKIPVQASPDLLLKALERLASETDDC